MATKANETYRAEIQLLVEKLAASIDRVGVFSFERVLMECRRSNVFEWRFVPDFTITQNRSWFGKIVPQYCGTFTLPDGRRVEFARVGTDHTRAFLVKIL